MEDLLYDYDEALDYLIRSKRDGERHIPTFAQHMLKRLMEVGLRHRTDTEPPANIRKATLEKGQEVWVLFDTRRDDEGYMSVEVIDTPQSDVAILAAMVAWLARKVDCRKLRAANNLVDSGDYAAQYEKINALFTEASKEGQGIASPSAQSALALLSALDAEIEPRRHLEYILPLLQYYRPDFDSRSPQEQQDLIEKACTHINGFLAALQRLQGFLEYGTPNQKKTTPAIKEPRRDVQAAILYDVDELNYRQIGERMGIPPPDLETKGENQTVRKMVEERGRPILEDAFGEEGWKEHVKKMKAQKARWQSLSQEERDNVIREETRALWPAY